MAQGKGWDKKTISELLEPKFRLGYSIEKACNSIGLAPTTFRTWLEDDEVLRRKVIAWQSEISDTAIKNLKIRVEGEDSEVSKWWLERKEKDEFGQRVSTENKNVNINTEVKDDDDRGRIIRGAIKGL